MEIVLYPHPALRWKSEPIQEIDTELRTIVAQMFELMYEAKGIGLAANQVAIPLRFFIVNVTGEANPDEEIVFINPEIKSRKGSEEGEEGCLSIPETFGQVRRAEQIVVEAYDLKGRGFEIDLDDLPGRVVQHETDHLDGILFPDRMTEMALKEIEEDLTNFEDVFRRKQERGEVPSDEELKKALRDFEL